MWQVTSRLTALELDAAREGISEEGKGASGTEKAYLSLEEYKEATAAGTLWCPLYKVSTACWPGKKGILIVPETLYYVNSSVVICCIYGRRTPALNPFTLRSIFSP